MTAQSFCLSNPVLNAKSKKASMYLLEKTTQAKVLKLSLYFPWVGYYKSDVGIRKILIFAKVTGQNSSKIQYGRHFKTVFCL